MATITVILTPNSPRRRLLDEVLGQPSMPLHPRTWALPAAKNERRGHGLTYDLGLSVTL